MNRADWFRNCAHALRLDGIASHERTTCERPDRSLAPHNVYKRDAVFTPARLRKVAVLAKVAGMKCTLQALRPRGAGGRRRVHSSDSTRSRQQGKTMRNRWRRYADTYEIRVEPKCALVRKMRRLYLPWLVTAPDVPLLQRRANPACNVG